MADLVPKMELQLLLQKLFHRCSAIAIVDAEREHLAPPSVAVGSHVAMHKALVPPPGQVSAAADIKSLDSWPLHHAAQGRPENVESMVVTPIIEAHLALVDIPLAFTQVTFVGNLPHLRFQVVW